MPTSEESFQACLSVSAQAAGFPVYASRVPHPASLPSAAGFSAHPGRSLPQAGSLSIILVSDWNFVNSCFTLCMQNAIIARRKIMLLIYAAESPVKQGSTANLVNQRSGPQLHCRPGFGDINSC